jgi:K+-sensing histidine kinase KdpD
MIKRKLFSNFYADIKSYGTALLLILGALVLTLLIWSLVQPLATPLFLAAIIISAWKKGFRAGIFATLLSVFVIDYFLLYLNSNSGNTTVNHPYFHFYS